MQQRLDKEEQFGAVLREGFRLKGLTQHQFAQLANISQTSVSLVGSHERKLSRSLAEALARIIGGSADKWLAVEQEFRSEGPKRSPNEILSEMTGGFKAEQSRGVGVRQLFSEDMIALFWKQKGNPNCNIQGFDPRRVRASSYYARLGYTDHDGHDPTKPLRGALSLAPGEAAVVQTLEAFHLPLWIEVDFHATSTMAKNNIAILNGPTIDPGFDKGTLRVTIRNIGDTSVTLDPADPFLKLRFKVFDQEAMDEDSLLNQIAQFEAQIDDEEIFKAATAPP